MTTTLEVEQYLDNKGISYKKALGANGMEAITSCPFCKDNKFHFYVNLTTGTYHCKKCNSGGGFLALKKELGDLANVNSFSDLVPQEPMPDIDLTAEVEAAHQALLASREGLVFFADRGFTPEVINKMKLGLSHEDGFTWVWYPFIKGGKAVNVKKRRIDEKKFKRITGAPSILYNVDATRTPTGARPEYIIVCEGEADVVALVSHGITNVVGGTTGAKGIASEWIQQLDPFQKIIFAYDNDEEGREGAHKFAERLGLERCYKLPLPLSVKDVNEYFLSGGTAESMARLIANAKHFEVQHVSTLGDVIKSSFFKSKNKEEVEKLHLPWKRLDFLMDGLVGGDLIVLAAKPAVGKTTMALNMLYHFAKSGVPSLLFELEMRPERITPRIVAMHLGIDSKLVMESDLLPQAYQELADIPFYFAYTYKKPTFDQVADTIRQSVRTYGIKFVVFDNLHFLVRSINDQTREVSVIVQSFKLLAEELGIPILAIARPRKNTGKIIANVDLKDSADIEGDADIIILLHRELKVDENSQYQDTEGTFRPEMLTKISKCRYSPGGQVNLIMDDKTARVKDDTSTK